MIYFLNAHALVNYPQLRRSMLNDRAIQFSHRLQWDVSVNEYGEETDEYDGLDPMYVICATDEGNHLGSVRLMPTVGRTMINDHFSEITGGINFTSKYMWECSRFCVSQRGSRKTAPALLAAVGRLMQARRIRNLIGVFDDKMERVYRVLKASPFVIGKEPVNNGIIGVGLWQYKEETYSHLLASAGISQVEMELFFANSELDQAKLIQSVGSD